MTDKDIQDAQGLVESMVQQINALSETISSLQTIVVEYQKFIVNHITGVNNE